MTSDGETTNIKVVDLEKLCNFVVDNFFHLNLFRASNNQCMFSLVNMWGTKLKYKHIWVIDGVVEEVTREGEVSGLNPTSSRIACDFTQKNARLTTSIELNLFSLFLKCDFIFSIKIIPRAVI